MHPLILGSQSPRRFEILSFFNLPFIQVSPTFDEDAIIFNGDPIAHGSFLAKGKADSLSHHYTKNIIITADTIVFKDGKSYAKPQNEQEAFQFLKELSGGWHEVYTAVCLRYEEKSFELVEKTGVLFNALTEEQMHTYYQSLSYQDKAGGYSIQGAGGLIVKKIDGCYYNVMGLPINSVRQLLLHVGIDLWNHLK